MAPLLPGGDYLVHPDSHQIPGLARSLMWPWGTASLSQFPHPRHRDNTTTLQRVALKPSFIQQMFSEHLLRAIHS